MSKHTRKNRKPKVIIMAGGTGGHVFPGIAIAKALQAKGVDVVWLGSTNGIENRIVPNMGFKLHMVEIRGLRGKRWHEKLFMPLRLTWCALKAVKIFLQEKPDLVLGMGGFAAAPGGMAAKMLFIPIIIHEQNSVAGLTNRWFAPMAKKILLAFPQTLKFKKNYHEDPHYVVTGNPLRAEISSIAPPEERYAIPHKPARLLILGGSHGAQALNDLVPRALALLPPEARPEICHQTGQAGHASTVSLYQSLNITAKIVPFIDDMAGSYAFADVVICRAGALTLTEIIQAGVASILVPYPFATDDHQTINAKYLVDQGGGILIKQLELTSLVLSEKLALLFNNDDLRLKMAKAARSLRQDNAVEKIVEQCLFYV